MPLSLVLLALQSELCALDWLMSLPSSLQYKGLDMVLPTMANIQPMYLSRDALSAHWSLEEKLQKGADSGTLAAAAIAYAVSRLTPGPHQQT
jgi:hypothetical protein